MSGGDKVMMGLTRQKQDDMTVTNPTKLNHETEDGHSSDIEVSTLLLFLACTLAALPLCKLIGTYQRFGWSDNNPRTTSFFIFYDKPPGTLLPRRKRRGCTLKEHC